MPILEAISKIKINETGKAYNKDFKTKNKLSKKGHDFISKFLNKITIPKDIRLAIDVDPLDIL